MQKTYIDIGNTLIKIFNNDKTYTFKNTDNFIEEIDTVVTWNEFVLIGSVVEQTNNIFIKYFKSKKIFFLLLDNKILFQKYPYENILGLGIDRYVDVIGSQEYENRIIIDFGTAITIDVIKENTYKTGMIYPGYEILSKSLSINTSLLGETKMSKFKEDMILRTTETQINNALLLGISGFLNEAIKKINNFNATVILTGGSFKNYFDKITGKLLKFKYTIDYDLNHKGLIKIGEKIENE